MRKKSFVIGLGVLLLLFTLSLPGLTANLIVPEDYSSIQAAVDLAESGDKILLSAGMHTEDVVISDKENLTLASRDLREFTIIKGQVTIENSVNITLRNITITGPGYGVAVRGATVGLTFDEMAVIKNHLDGFNFSGGETRYYHLKISNCRIASNAGDGITLGSMGNDINIRKNRILDNGTFTPGTEAAGAAGGTEPKGGQSVGIRLKLQSPQAGGAGAVGPEILRKYIIQDNIEINTKGEASQQIESDAEEGDQGTPAGGAGAAGETEVLRVIIEDNILRGNTFAALHTTQG